MNIPNGVLVSDRPKMRCFRCGEDDHMLKNCPMPYNEVLAFAPKVKAQVKDAPGVKKTFVCANGSVVADSAAEQVGVSLEGNGAQLVT